MIAAPMAAAGLAFTAVGLSSVGPVAGGALPVISIPYLH